MHDDFNFAVQDLEVSLDKLYCHISHQTIKLEKEYIFCELMVIGSTYCFPPLDYLLF